MDPTDEDSPASPPTSEWATDQPADGGDFSEPPPPARPPIPWEEPGRPWFAALVDTVGLLYTRPREAFERMPIRGDLLRPLIFGVLTGWVGQVFAYIWDVSLRGFIRNLMPGYTDYGKYQLPDAALPFIIALAPLWIVVALFIGAAISHVFLTFVGGAKRGFQATLRTLCYTQASSLLIILPICGAFIAVVAAITFQIIGLSAAHGISTGRAAASVALQFLLCCLCVLGTILVFGAMFAGLMGSD